MCVIWKNQPKNQNSLDYVAGRYDDEDSDGENNKTTTTTTTTSPSSAASDNTDSSTTTSAEAAGAEAGAGAGAGPRPARKRSSTIVSKNLDLAADIPGLPTKEDWNTILKGSKAVAFKEGEVIVHEGEKIQKVFQIMRGSCVVQRKVTGTDAVLTLSRMETHDFFGEISFLLGEGASGSVVAAEGGAEVVALGGDFVNILLSAKPQLASKFFKYLAVLLQRRLRSFQDRTT